MGIDSVILTKQAVITSRDEPHMGKMCGNACLSVGGVTALYLAFFDTLSENPIKSVVEYWLTSERHK